MGSRVSRHAKSSDYLALGRAVRDLRERRGVSQHVASFDAGMGVNYFGLLERGLASPTFATLLWIARMFGSTIEELVVRYDWHLYEIDPHAGCDVPQCPTPTGLEYGRQGNARDLARYEAAKRRGRMRSWT